MFLVFKVWYLAYSHESELSTIQMQQCLGNESEDDYSGATYKVADLFESRITTQNGSAV